MYKLQVKSQSKIGYVTITVALQSSIHLSKRKRKLASHSESNAVFATDIDDASSAEVSSNLFWHSICIERKWKWKWQRKGVVHFLISHVAMLITKNYLSSNKAAVMCSSLTEDGISVLTPSQSSVWRVVIRSGKDVKR